MKVNFKKFNLGWICLIPTICIDYHKLSKGLIVYLDFNFINKGLEIVFIRGDMQLED